MLRLSTPACYYALPAVIMSACFRLVARLEESLACAWPVLVPPLPVSCKRKPESCHQRFGNSPVCKCRYRASYEQPNDMEWWGDPMWRVIRKALNGSGPRHYPCREAHTWTSVPPTTNPRSSAHSLSAAAKASSICLPAASSTSLSEDASGRHTSRVIFTDNGQEEQSITIAMQNQCARIFQNFDMAWEERWSVIQLGELLCE